jgi:transketolase N-terminal domain/subunit
MALHFIERTLNEGQYRDAVLTTHEVDEFNLVSLIDSQEFQYENITQQIYRISHEVIYD